uniref:OB domain-containing protein n=1 Tax=Plectus sambesii TaxID=2011161 RepID=A0A914X371_9BILA
MLQNGQTSGSLHLAAISPIKASNSDAKSKTFCGIVEKKRAMTISGSGNEYFNFNLKDETATVRVVAFGENAKKWDSYITEGQKYKLSKLNSKQLLDHFKSAEVTEDVQLIIEQYSIIELCPAQSSVPISNASAPAAIAARNLSATSIVSDGQSLAQALNFLTSLTTPPAATSVTPTKPDLKRKTATPVNSLGNCDISAADKKHEDECKAICRSVLSMLRKVDPESIHRVHRELQDVLIKNIDEYNEKKKRLFDQPSTSH